MLSSIKLLGVTITNETEGKVSEYIVEKLRKGGSKSYIVTPNPEILVYAASHPAYKDKLNGSEASLPDGVGILLAAKILGKPVKNRVTGVDFMETLYKATKDKPISMGFLGGRRGVAEKAAQCLKSKYPWVDVAFVGEEWDESKVVKGKGIDILFVAFGFPKQEEWIVENLEKLPVKMAMGVGGAFDYLSGEVTRAPKFLRAMGLEWLFRLIRQPWRLKRQLSLLKFIYLILQEKLK